MSGTIGPGTGNNTDPVFAAYQATPVEQQPAFKSLFESGLYTDDQIAASLIYLTGFRITGRQVTQFKQKLAQGRITW